MRTRESRPQGAAPEQSAQTATDTVQDGSVAERCRFTDAVCRCAAEAPTMDDCREAFSHELAAQLRRRREAAWQLPPMADGRRDPLGPITDAPARTS